MQVSRWFLRKRVKHILLTSIFTLALILSVMFGSSLPTYTQTPTLTPREKVILDIKEDAKRDLQNNGSMQIMVVINTYKNNSVGLTIPEIVDIYEKEYIRLRKEKPWLQLPIGWITTTIILSILLIFRDVLKEWLSNLFKILGNWLYNKLDGSPLILGKALRRYQKSLFNSYKELHIPFRPNRPLDMRELYVPLKVEGRKDSDLIDAKRAISEYSRLMVKGAPGSGKSMLLKHIVLSYGEKRLLNLPERPIPILLELHRLNAPDFNEEKLQQQLVAVLARHDFPKAERFVEQRLKHGKLMLLFDGLDEVNSNVRRQIVQVIKDLLNKYKKCRAIITCRTAVYQNEFTEVVEQTLESVKFSDRQIRSFLQSWSSQMPPDKSIEQLMQTLRDRPKIMALARNPLLLTIMAYLYTDTPFVLPHSRAEFYQKSTDILLEQWGKDFNRYRANDKKRILQHLALYNQDNANQQQQDRRSIDDQTVLVQLQQILPALNLQPNTDTQPILDEIVERSGLLLKIDSGERYQFAHLTLQEFLAAAALKERGNELIDRFRADPKAWRETVKLWCGLAGDSTELIKAAYAEDALTGFECLADASEVELELAEKIIEEFKVRLDTTEEEDSLVQAFGSMAADFRPRGQAVFLYLEEALASSEKLVCQRAAKALSMTNLPQAAKVLGLQYDSQADEIRESLVRMGDLAVPELVSKANEGYIEALNDLLAIATPDAANALVPFLWQNEEELASLAAWNLATLIPQFDIEESLHNFPLTEEQRKADYLDWVWLPFSTPTNSALPIIAGRIAYLLKQAPLSAIPTLEQNLDPRVIIPLCAIELVNQGEFKNRWNPDRDDLLAQPEPTPELDRVMRKLIRKLLKDKTTHSPWSFLFSSLAPRLQLDLLRRLSNYGQPTIGNWCDLFLEVEYEFKNSWHYRLVLVLALAMSMLAIVGIVQIIVSQPERWSNGLLGLAILVVFVFWIFLWRGIEEKLEPTTFISFGLFGALTHW